MTLFVSEIHHDGLGLGDGTNQECLYWLPAASWEGRELTWEEFREGAEPGMAIGVTLPADGGLHHNLKIVGLTPVGARELDEKWKGEVHSMTVEAISRTLIRGSIDGIPAVIQAGEYADFLDRFHNHEHVQEHGALATGDVLPGVFRSENGPEDRVLVSFADAMNVLRQESKERVEAEHESSGEGAAPSLPLVQPSRAAVFHSAPEALSPFLFVENDDLCREMWKAVLTDAGVEVDAFSTFIGAHHAIQNSDRNYKMALIDVHLSPGASDYLGLQLAQTIAVHQNDCRIVISSAEENSKQKGDRWGAVQVHGYVVKPALMSEWISAVDDAALMRRKLPLRDFLRATDAEVAAPIAVQPGVDTGFSPTLRQVLGELVASAPGTVVHVFRLHPRSWRGTSVAHAGGKLNWEPYRGKFAKSLIRDAAESDEAIMYNSVDHFGVHLWTRLMTDYQSFWGQRLAVPGNYRYVLVAFHPARDFFTLENHLRARCSAEMVTRILCTGQLERRGTHDAELSSAGLGFACLAHEIFGTLSGMDSAVARITALLAAPPPGDGTSWEDLRTTVERFSRRVPVLVNNARILRGKAGGSEPISIIFCLEKAVEGIRLAMQSQSGDPDNIVVTMENIATRQSWLTRTNASALVTIFFNVLLNAVQQIAIFSNVSPKGWVSATATCHEDENGRPWACIFIKDSGPGIHPEDWEQIFQPGYSTKENGTGLGLHICRRLLSEMNEGNRLASIQVVRSTLWAGTTIAIRLPLAAASENAGDIA